jgi:hypothetical protein
MVTVNISVTIDNVRIPSVGDTIQTAYVWRPFNLTSGHGIGGASFAIFTNGAWVLSHKP